MLGFRRSSNENRVPKYRTVSVPDEEAYAGGLAVLTFATVYLGCIAFVLEMIHCAPTIDDPSWR